MLHLRRKTSITDLKIASVMWENVYTGPQKVELDVLARADQPPPRPPRLRPLPEPLKIVTTVNVPAAAGTAELSKYKPHALFPIQEQRDSIALSDNNDGASSEKSSSSYDTPADSLLYNSDLETLPTSLENSRDGHGMVDDETYELVVATPVKLKMTELTFLRRPRLPPLSAPPVPSVVVQSPPLPPPELPARQRTAPIHPDFIVPKRHARTPASVFVYGYLADPLLLSLVLGGLLPKGIKIEHASLDGWTLSTLRASNFPVLTQATSQSTLVEGLLLKGLSSEERQAIRNFHPKLGEEQHASEEAPQLFEKTPVKVVLRNGLTGVEATAFTWAGSAELLSDAPFDAKAARAASVKAFKAFLL